ncbi:RNA silencing suppressor [Fig virus A]|uniref:PSS n=1 Tax=Fig closterovirus 2 TaxID=2809011 RepID=A0A8A0Y3L2_9CLOS|nr:RNA silencing suppressor [Fig virus A]QSQ86326.1 pSS [Fig closterovirus 2]
MRYFVNENTYATFFLQLDELKTRCGAIDSLKPAYVSDLCVELNALISLYYVMLHESRNNYYSTEDHVNIKKHKDLKEAYKGLTEVLSILRNYYAIEYGAYDVENAVRFIVSKYISLVGCTLNDVLKSNMVDITEYVMNEIRREIQIDFTSAAFPQSGVYRLKMKVRNVLKNILGCTLNWDENGSLTISKKSAGVNAARVMTSQSERE